MSSFALFWGCADHSDTPSHVNCVIKEVPVDCREGGMPNLFVSDAGNTFLSWIEYLDDTTDALMYSILQDSIWSAPREIARGTDWFVNWADFPSLVAMGEEDQMLTAHFLQKRTSETYDYDILITQSVDGGKEWTEPFVLHQDGIAAEHGFVTLLPFGDDKIFATWLDGRHMRNGASSAGGHGHGGPMSLRSVIFDVYGNRGDSHELDSMVCDCCQTDAVIIKNGPVVVYRDRTAGEVRDIGITRYARGQWTEPGIVHHDNWMIAGCPVNGPALAHSGDTLAVAWVTVGDSILQVNVAFSVDGGASFRAPVRIDDGRPLGRVDIVMLDHKVALVSWMEVKGASGQVLAARVSMREKIGENIVISNTDLSRQSGFPVMKKLGDQVVLGWTKVDTVTTIGTAFLRF